MAFSAAGGDDFMRLHPIWSGVRAFVRVSPSRSPCRPSSDRHTSALVHEQNVRRSCAAQLNINYGALIMNMAWRVSFKRNVRVTRQHGETGEQIVST